MPVEMPQRRREVAYVVIKGVVRSTRTIRAGLPIDKGVWVLTYR